MFKRIADKVLEFVSKEPKEDSSYKEPFRPDKDFISFLEKEADSFIFSKKRADMFIGERYYDGIHDIIKRKRTIIGQGGEITEVSNLPNNIIIDNQYARMVDQKNNYLLSKELTFNCEDKAFLTCVKDILGADFLKILKNIGQDCLNCGIGYLYVYYDDFGKLSFKRLSPFEIVPFWVDEEHSSLKYALRIFEKEIFKGGNLSTINKAELFLPQGIVKFIVKGKKLVPEDNGNIIPYISQGDKCFDFGKLPIIPFRQNDRELPLILRIKELQDALNIVQSDFMNNLQEDARNTILVLKNYDGTNLGEFRKNLAKYGAVKVKSTDGCEGGVSTLKIDVNGDNFKTVISSLKQAIVENARGIDSKSEKMLGNLSKMNIQSIYSDIDLDANSMETEFKASFEALLFFIRFFAKNAGIGDFYSSSLKVIFNRDILINETESIENCVKSLQILSKETVISCHPWVSDVLEEEKKLRRNNYGQGKTSGNRSVGRTSRYDNSDE